jgi:hypothetical protein
MDELVKMVAQKMNLTPEQAKVAVELVVTHLKSKLPAPVAGQIDGVLNSASSGLSDIAKGIGKLFGRK